MRATIAPILVMVIWFAGNGVSVPQERVAKPTFFPESAFDSKDRKDDGFHQRWYFKHLAAMREPALYNSTRRQNETRPEIYRFVWLRSFHHPISVRVEKGQGEKVRLVVKELDGKGGYATGVLTLDKTKTISDAEWSGSTKGVDECGFWKLPTVEQHWYVEDGMTVGWAVTDGAQWILEGTKGNEYHVVDRQSPDDDNHRKAGKYRAACLQFLQLSGLDVAKERVY